MNAISISTIVENVREWVCTIDTHSSIGAGCGSGVILNTDGYIMTNHHVIQSARDIMVTLYGESPQLARLINSDKYTDIAVLKIESINQTPSFAEIGTVKVGQQVVAVGNPYGLGLTVTSGIISGINRSINVSDSDLSIESLIQTDAAINPGNSGGALIRLEDQTIVGINTAAFTNASGIGFAVPIDLAIFVAQEIVSVGHFNRPRLGVRGTELTPTLSKYLGLSRPRGVLIENVFENSTGEELELIQNDIIYEIDDVPIYSMWELMKCMAKKRIGDNIKIRIARGDEELLKEAEF